MFKCRASQLSKLMTNPRSKTSGELSETAKSMIEEQLLLDLFGFKKPIKSQFLEKGNDLEDVAIQMVGLLTYTQGLAKNSERRENDWISGECDIVMPNFIRDTKCSWSIGTFPFTKSEAEKSVKEGGYDWQGQAYMWLWDKPVHYVDFVLLPAMEHMLRFNDDPYMYTDCVNAIPAKKRFTSVCIEADIEKRELVKTKVEAARIYYDTLKSEIEGK